jgi:hypothetical protein
MKVPKVDFVTFSELAVRWSYSAAYLHDLIRNEKIIPAVVLTDQERYVGGEFRGGYYVGDIENATHRSYAEYYIGTTVGDDDYYENWPQCSRLVFCHTPVDEANGSYSFQFLSETSSRGHTAQWFYLDNAQRINSSDAEWRFRFTWSEIERFEKENRIGEEDVESQEAEKEISLVAESTKAQSSLQPCGILKPVPTDKTGMESDEGESSAQEQERNSVCLDASVHRESPELGRRVHSLKQRRTHPVRAEINEAINRAVDREDINTIWTALLNLAYEEYGCLLGAFRRQEDGEDYGLQVKYRKDNGREGWFSKKNLRDRLSNRQNR